MADQRDGGIAWTDATWNPIRGCSRISAGCTSCYAEAVAARFSDKGMSYEGLARRTPAGPRWTGKLAVIDEHMADPLRWTRPRRIFVNSMSDLFHERLSDEQIARVFAVMYLAPRHTFQVLTKRAERMRRTLTSPGFYRLVLDHANAFRQDFPGKRLASVAISDPTKFPHANVWLGVSVENQQAANERIPELLGTPAAVRFLSCEPLLEPVRLDLSRSADGSPRSGISWVIIGGESGPNARPFNVAWARELVLQASAAGVAPFVKQLGANVRTRNDDGLVSDFEEGGWLLEPERVEADVHGYREDHQGAEVRVRLIDRSGSDVAEWPLDLRRREFPTEVVATLVPGAVGSLQLEVE